MSTLWLIRHAQASFGASDYDVLSELGVRQSRLLGDWLATTRTPLDAVYTGPRRRQIDTAAHLLAAARAAGARVPEGATVLEDLDEFPWEEVLRAAPVADAAGFADALSRWARGELLGGGEHSFAAFSTRVRRGVDRILETEGRGRKVACVTSAGPIALTVQKVLELNDRVALRLPWNLQNASLTRIEWNDRELSLVSYNTTPHLGEPELLTRR